MDKWFALLQYSQWHEDGIESAIGPFDTEQDAENAIPGNRIGYAVKGSLPIMFVLEQYQRLHELGWWQLDVSSH